jgi:hypothetical protein
VAARERASEARWISETLHAATGRRVDADDALHVLRLHEAYLAAAPPDELDEDEADDALGEDVAGASDGWRRRWSTEAAPGPSPTEIAAPGGRAGVAEARAPMAHPIATRDAADGSTRDR